MSLLQRRAPLPPKSTAEALTAMYFLDTQEMHIGPAQTKTEYVTV